TRAPWSTEPMPLLNRCVSNGTLRSPPREVLSLHLSIQEELPDWKLRIRPLLMSERVIFQKMRDSSQPISQEVRSSSRQASILKCGHLSFLCSQCPRLLSSLRMRIPPSKRG